MGVEFAPGASGAPACRWKTYPDYKDSGVEWLGEIPVDWIVTLLKRAFDVQLGKMLQSTQTSEDDTLEPYLRVANIFWNGVDITDVKEMWFSPYEKDHYFLRNDDLLISEGGDVGRSAIWKGDIEHCYIQNAINRVRSREMNSTQFLYYWIYVLKFNGYIDMLCNKATIAHFTAEKVERTHIILPPPTEQRSITAFLDRKTAHIDILISKKERLITLLHEKRAALISHTVTKGLDPDVPMKDSGVEWLGEIPAHWVNIRLKMLVNLINQKAGNENIKYIGLENIESLTGNIVETDVTPEGIANLFSSNDVLFGKLRPYLSKVLIPDFEGCCTSELLVLRPKKITRHFLFFYFLSDQFIEIVNSSTYGAKMPRANWDFIGNMVISCPPAIEQRNITSFLDCGIEKIDALISKIQKAIKTLQEYRTALISAAVTGKIDVRNENRN